MLFCVDFFGKEGSGREQLAEYLSGDKQVPIPTYFTLNHAQGTDLVDDKPEGGEVCANLHYLGRTDDAGD